jgi:hypothetical protein
LCAAPPELPPLEDDEEEDDEPLELELLELELSEGEVQAIRDARSVAPAERFMAPLCQGIVGQV